jgi:hypothetical protein
VREGTGRAAKLRRVMNARMEEMSFRSGVVVVTGVLALAAAVIALTVTLGGGHRAAAAPSASPSSSAWPTYRPMGLSPSHSLKTPGIHP